MKKTLLLALLSSLLLAFSFKDTIVLKILILNKLSEYITKNYPEKIYIQTDRPYYIAGENIWFNTYLVNGVNLKELPKARLFMLN